MKLFKTLKRVRYAFSIFTLSYDDNTFNIIFSICIVALFTNEEAGSLDAVSCIASEEWITK